jgi:hypothetical protein
MADPNSAPQSNYQSNQNYDIDVAKMFRHFVTGGASPDSNEPGENVGIDDIRGQISVSVTGSKTKDLITSLNIDPTSTTMASTPSTTTPVLQVQESRCHALYRIIGFPVVSSDKKTFYNPGFDVVKVANNKRTITLSYKISTATNVGTAFETISQARETWAANTAKVFNVPQSVEAGVLSLTSGTYGSQGNINLRAFAAPFTKNQSQDPFDFKVADQTYSMRQNSLVGNSEIALTNFQDAAGNSLTSDQTVSNPIFFTHQHIIVPFLVDPRIDFSIWASESKTFSGLSKRIAIPFVPDASFLKVSSTATAERPLLEKIIRDRLYQSNNTAAAGQAVQSTVDFVQSFKSIQSINIGSTTISDIFSNSVFKTSRQNAFANTLSTIQTMMQSLVNSMRIVHAAQGTYYWLPQPAISGPEAGSSVRPVPINQNFSSTLVAVPGDSDIIFNQAQSLFSGLTTNSAQANAVPDRGGFAFSGQTLTFDNSTSDSLGDLSSQTMETLSAKRTRLLTKAGNALQIIEMIMGEFSGLGLSDIIAVVNALYVIPIEDLLGLLDDDAYARAGVSLNQSLATRSSIGDAMQSLANTVNGLYQVMDQIFQDYLRNNALNL